MANVPETPNFDSGVYQFELTDRVMGGADGVDNLPHKQLANRTQWLKAQVESLQGALAALTADVSEISSDLSGVSAVASAAQTAAEASNTFWQGLTGVYLPYGGLIPPPGWVFLNGRTIGKSGSGATLRENNDTQALFVLLWGSHTNTALPIQDSGGAATTRGFTALDDFNANKRLPVPDLRGRVVAGRDSMGSVPMLRISHTILGEDPSLMGSAGGAETHQLTSAQMPSHAHGASGTGFLVSAAGSYTFPPAGSAARVDGATANAGSDQPHPNLQPTIIANYIIKL